MGICGSLEGLKSIWAVPQTTSAATQTESGIAASQSALSGNQATLSSVGSAASLTATDSGVRADKVAEIQVALAAGTYHVPASAVASKVVYAMCAESAAKAVREPTRISPLNIVFSNVANATVDATQAVSDTKTLSGAFKSVSSSA